MPSKSSVLELELRFRLLALLLEDPAPPVSIGVPSELIAHLSIAEVCLRTPNSRDCVEIIVRVIVQKGKRTKQKPLIQVCLAACAVFRKVNAILIIIKSLFSLICCLHERQTSEKANKKL